MRASSIKVLNKIVFWKGICLCDTCSWGKHCSRCFYLLDTVILWLGLLDIVIFGFSSLIAFLSKFFFCLVLLFWLSVLLLFLLFLIWFLSLFVSLLSCSPLSCPCFLAHVVLSLAYPNLLPTKRLGCYCWSTGYRVRCLLDNVSPIDQGTKLRCLIDKNIPNSVCQTKPQTWSFP
jgi:hypothetical protein